MKPSLFLKFLFFAVVLFGYSGHASATSWYTEGSDLSNTLPGPVIGTITSAGSYTVSGTLATPADYQDWFQVVIASGLQLSNVTYSISGGAGFDGNWNMNGYNSAGITGNSSGSMSMSGSGFSYPFSAGTFDIEIGTDFSVGNSYVITLVVTNAPSTSTSGDIAFVNGSPQSLSMCTNSGANSINSKLVASDDQAGETLTWSVNSAPAHGTLGGFNTTATSIVGNSTPSGLTYTPATNYSGTDAFIIAVDNGTNTTLTTINVNVNALPTPSFTAPPGANVCASAATTYTTQSGMSGYSWSIPGTPGTNYNITSGGITTNSVGITWLTAGSKTVTVNYTNSNSCTSTTPASNTTSVNALPVPTFTAAPGANVCASTQSTYTTQAGMSSYSWSIPGTSGTDYNVTAGGTGTNSVGITWLTAGSKIVTVNYTTSNGCTGTTATSNTTSVNALPVPSFTSPVATHSCTGGNVIYTTQSGMSGYTWTIPGVSGTDYTITGGSTSSNTIMLDWMTAGTKAVTINYTNASLCTGAAAVANTTTVNPLPVPSFTATPTASICASTNETYSTQSGMTGYTWTIPGVPSTDYTITGGSITSNTVTLKWLTAGSKTVGINYTNGNGCTANTATTTTSTVNALPTPAFSAAPTATTCASTNVTYTTQAGKSSYVWSVPGIAGADYIVTGGSATGTSNTVSLKWMSAGAKTVTINYTDANGCTALASTSATTTVNALPIPTFTAAPGANVCVQNNIVAYTTQLGMTNYTWTLSGIRNTDYFITSGDIGTTNSAFTLVWNDAGSKTVTINYTDLNGCTGATAVTNTTSANPLPSPITGNSYICLGLTAAYSSTSAATWSSSNAAVASILPSGMATGISLGSATLSYTSSMGCYVIKNVTVSALPAVHTITGGGHYCFGGAGIPVGLNGSDAGINYQLYNGTTPAGSALAGTGSALSFGSITFAGSYSIVATNATTGCTSNMTGSTAVIIDPLPPLHTVTGGGHYCYLGAGLHAGLDGSDAGINYQLFNGLSVAGSALPGTGTTLDFGAQIAAGTYTIVGTDGTTGCTNSMAGSVTISIDPLPAIDTVTGGGNYCAAGTGVHVGLNNSDAGISYQLYNGASLSGSAMAGGSVIDFGLETAAGNYTVVATNTTTGCISNMADTATVGINPLPNTYIVTGGGDYCIGGTGVHVGLSNSDGGISYQLYYGGSLSGTPVAGTATALDFGAYTAAGTYTVIATNNITSCVQNMGSNASVTIDPLPAVYTVTGGGSYCFGGTGVHVDLTGSVVGTSYQLYYSSAPISAAVAGSGSTLDFGSYTGAGAYTVIATNTTTGCVNSMASSAAVSINPLPAVHTVTGGGSYCATGTGVHAGLDASEAGISYQLYDGSATGSPLAGTYSPLDFGFQTAPGAYTVIATDTLTHCVNNMAGSVTVNVLPLPVAYSLTGGGSYCAGGTGLMVGLSASQIGVNYQLMDDTGAVGAPRTGIGAALNFGIFTAADTFTVVATNTATSCANSMSGRSVVNINPLPVVYNVTGGGNYCPGAAGVHVGLDNSDTAISYHLFNGTASAAAMAGTGAALDFGLETAGNYTMVATDTRTHCTNNMAGSAAVAVTVIPVPVVALTAHPAIITAGQYDTLKATITGGGPSPTYEWMVNGTYIAGATNATYISNTLNNGDEVICIVTSSSPCGSNIGSQTITIAYSTTGVATVTNTATDVLLMPNPNKGSFTVKGSIGTEDEQVTMELTDMAGQVVYLTVVAAIGGNINEHIQVGNTLANGMYLLTLHTAGGNKVFHVVIGQ